MKNLKYVPTFESFTNEAKVELGHIDSGSMEDKWKIEQINDQLKGAIGKTCTFLDIISLAGHREEGVENRTSTASTPDSILKNIKCKIVKVYATGSYANLVHQVFYTYDTAPYDGYSYPTKDGVPDLTGEIATYSSNRAKDENGNFNGAGVKFKDFPSIYPDCDASELKNGGSSLTKGTFDSSDSFMFGYPKPNRKNGLVTFSRFADIFGLGDITPNFPDAKGNVTDYDNVDYYDKLSVNCYQFIKGSMSKMVSFMQAGDVRLYGNNHTTGSGVVLCNKKDLKKIHADLLDGFEGKKPRLNNIPMIGLDAKAEENGSVIDSPIYQEKWAKVCQFLGARDTSDLVCVNILMRLGGPSTNHANNSFSEEEIDYAKVQYNGFDGWSRANVPEGIAPLVKRMRVKKYASGKLS